MLNMYGVGDNFAKSSFSQKVDLGPSVDSYDILKNYLKSCKTVLVEDSKLVYYRAFFLLLYNICVLLLV